MNASNYEPVIGLEVHCQLKTRSKMFSSCAVQLGAEPNTQIDAYTLGLPGTLPVPNRQAVEFAIRMGLAAKSTIQSRSLWARKHYFYPDLPKGYQITQADNPYAEGGEIEVPHPQGQDEGSFRVRLIRIHMEEDAGKNIHRLGEDVSLLDFNRAGAPLLEIVSMPDLHSPEAAGAYLRELRKIIRFLAISDANMEEGTLRCDANVSLRPVGSQALGTRCEIKNLNSFKYLESAIRAEIRRQSDILTSGGNVTMATLSYDTTRDCTRIMRSKEEAADYRYFPEPDMPPLLISEQWVAQIKASMPELPQERRHRYRSYGLSMDDADLLTSDPAIAMFFDEAYQGHKVSAKKVFNWISVELLGRLYAHEQTLEQSLVKPSHIGELVDLIEQGTISGRIAKDIFERCFQEGRSPKEIVEQEGHAQISDSVQLAALVQEVLQANPQQLAQYRRGKLALKGYFVGQIMKQTKGQANPQRVHELLEKALEAVNDEPGNG